MGDLPIDYDVVEDEDDDDDERVHEWEHGLPNPDELFSLTQGLVPPDLLSAFNIRPEPCRTSADVTRASRDTLESIQGGPGSSFVKPYSAAENNLEEEEGEGEGEGSESKKARRSGNDVKRTRLVWTPQLHKRFVDVVAHLGIKNAVPKTIMQMMNVEGLTRENVASHLQKYRLYLKRMQGVSFDQPENSSTANSTEQLPPQPQPSQEIPMSGTYGQQQHPMMQMQMQMHMPVPMPMMPMGHMGMGMGMGNHHHHHHNYYHHYQYNGGRIMQAGGGNSKHGSGNGINGHPPHHVAPPDK